MPTSAPPSLPELQRWMRWVLTHPAGAAAVVATPRGRVKTPRHWSRGPEPKRQLAVIGESATVGKGARLSIYGKGYFLRLVGVLASTFPSLRAAVGDHAFDHHLGRDYLVKYPSLGPCIDDVGAHMARFLKGRPETKRLKFLPDLARLEWAYHESFFADERTPMDMRVLDGHPLEAWEGARVWLDPSVRLLDLTYPVIALWRDDGNWSRRRLEGIQRGGERALVYRRPDGQVRVAAQAPGAFALLRAFDQAVPFGRALKKSMRATAVTPGRLMRLFRDWSELGVIRSVALR